jgi:hypothetical protein
MGKSREYGLARLATGTGVSGGCTNPAPAVAQLAARAVGYGYTARPGGRELRALRVRGAMSRGTRECRSATHAGASESALRAIGDGVCTVGKHIASHRDCWCGATPGIR